MYPNPLNEDTVRNAMRLHCLVLFSNPAASNVVNHNFLFHQLFRQQNSLSVTQCSQQIRNGRFFTVATFKLTVV